MAYLEYVKKMSVGSEEIHSVLHIRERRGLPLVHRFYSDVVVVVVVEVAVDVAIRCLYHDNHVPKHIIYNNHGP